MGWEMEQIPQMRSARYRTWTRFRCMPMNSIPRWAKPGFMSTPTIRSPSTWKVNRICSFRAGCTGPIGISNVLFSIPLLPLDLPLDKPLQLRLVHAPGMDLHVLGQEQVPGVRDPGELHP